MQRKFDGLLIKLTNEGIRTVLQGHNLKLMGMLPGASDLFLAYPTQQYHGLWLEIKQNRKYTPSEMTRPTWLNQEKFLSRMISVGFQGHFCYGYEHGIALIESYLMMTTIPC